MSDRGASSNTTAIDSLLFFGIFGALGAFAVDWALSEQIKRSTPAGTVQRVSGAGGLRGRLLIETESAYYPVYELLAIEKGTPLLLQERGNGDWYLCDARTQVCMRTSGVVLKNPSPKGTL